LLLCVSWLSGREELQIYAFCHCSLWPLRDSSSLHYSRSYNKDARLSPAQAALTLPAYYIVSRGLASNIHAPWRPNTCLTHRAGSHVSCGALHLLTYQGPNMRTQSPACDEQHLLLIEPPLGSRGAT